ncbi:MAG: hypothetical protein OEV00_07820 [Acidobacteriota bacterium]|nr:hypothetical protein [Acidobacteriota bacterium]MDH3785221.1 hypothetical protein [Acidobacteriota bacterium]
MKRFAPVALLMTVAVSALAIPAIAQEFRPYDEPPTRFEERVQRQGEVVANHGERLRPSLMVVARALELDEFQIGNSIELLTVRRQAVLPLAREIDLLEHALEELIKSDDPNPAAIGVLVLQIRELRQAIGSHQQTFIEAFVSQLDEDQQGRLARINLAASVAPVLPAFKKLGLV